MDIKRRTFLQAASVGTAGLIVPQAFGHPLAGESQHTAAGQKPSMLDLRIWGSCLYVFSKDRRRLELAFFGAATAATGHTLAHQPQLVVGNARVKHVSGKLDVNKGTGLWTLPSGEIKISTGAQETQPSLTALLDEHVTACPLKPEASKDFDYTLNSLAYVPRLRVRGGSLKGWRTRATTRIVLTAGTLNAIAPHKVPGEIAEMELLGPAAQSTSQVVTDTTKYSVPLVDGTVTFSCAQGTVTYESIAGEPLRLVIQAGPASTGNELPLREGDRLPHWYALYSVFDTMPAEKNRAELRIKQFCFPHEERDTIRTARAARISRRAPSPEEGRGTTARAVSGPTPGDLCPGAIIILNGDTE